MGQGGAREGGRASQRRRGRLWVIKQKLAKRIEEGMVKSGGNIRGGGDEPGDGEGRVAVGSGRGKTPGGRTIKKEKWVMCSN